MKSALAIISLLGVTRAVSLHPVRQEIVDDIKLKTDSWQPNEVSKNHLRDVHPDKLKDKMGSLGSGVSSFFDKISSYFGTFKLGQNVYEDEDYAKGEIIKGDPNLPKSFDWRQERPKCMQRIRD